MLLFFHYLTEIVAIAIIYEFYPVISYLLYMITPMWMEVNYSLTYSFIHSLSYSFKSTIESIKETISLSSVSYDSEPPELELDPSVVLSGFTHSLTRSPTYSLTYSLTRLLTHSLTHSDDEDGKEEVVRDIHVYDPVYGVIPLETLELWKKQEEEARERRLLAIQNGKNKILPPVCAVMLLTHSYYPYSLIRTHLLTYSLTHPGSI